jgi:5'-methylthioadenosine phosphorylase
VDTPFGKPSSPITIGKLEGKPVAFLARHGIGHVFPPSEVPYRANIYALKSLGVSRIVSISACGSLRESYAPGHIVIPHQIFDFTHKRDRSFFDSGLVAHVSVAEPFCKGFQISLRKPSNKQMPLITGVQSTSRLRAPVFPQKVNPTCIGNGAWTSSG